MANTTFVPDWKKYEKDLHSDDNEKARQAADAFQESREKEIQNSAKARKWEEDRKKEIFKNKPEWVKKRIKKENEFNENIIKDLKEGGHLMGSLKPSPGLLVVKHKDAKGESQGGIVLPDSVEYESNLAIAVRVGEGTMNAYGEIKPPCKEGDTVLFRKGAGLNVKVNGEPHLIIRFDEVFGVVEE